MKKTKYVTPISEEVLWQPESSLLQTSTFSNTSEDLDVDQILINPFSSIL